MAEGIELLRRYASDRSEAAFTALVQQYLSLVYHAALRRTNGDTHLAEEVAQTVFAKLAKEAASLQHHAVLTGWLYVATRHAAANAMRSEQRRKAREQEAHTMNEATTDEPSGAEWAHLRLELDSVMDELGEVDRDAVLLRFFENRPYAEIGASFRISEDAARMRVDRALEKLRALLARRGITSTAAALSGLLVAQSTVAAPAGLAGAVAGSALAGAGITVGACSAGPIAFMTTNKIAMVAAGVVAALSLGTVWHVYQENGRLAGELAEAHRGVKMLQAQLQDQSRHLKHAEENLRQAQVKAAEAAAAAGSGTPEGGRENNAAKVKSILATTGSVVIVAKAPFADPDYVRLQLKMTEVNMKLQYGPMYRTLGWGAEKIREFERISLQQAQNTFDIMSVANANGVPLNSPGLNQQWNDPEMQELSESLRRLMGDKDYAAYQEYSDPQHTVARYSVDGLAGSLYYTEAPLLRSQAEQLTDLIAKHTIKPTQAAGPSRPPKPDWDVVYAQAKAFLTTEQIETLRTINSRNEVGEQLAKILTEMGAMRPSGT